MALKDEYNGKSKGIAVFQMQLSDQAQTEGWAKKYAGDIINIPKDGVDVTNGILNITKRHTQISVATITMWCSNTRNQ